MTESQTIEFKQIWKDEYLKTICAFANTDGGNLYIGLDDESNVNGKTWDDIAEENFTLEEIDLNTIQKFKNLAKDRAPNIQNENDLEELLKKLNLYDGKYLKRAAILLFAKNPQKYYIQSHSKIGRFLSETDIQSSDIIEGNLIDQVDKIMDVLRLKYLKAYISYEGMHRREKLEYPYNALREAVINALIHRDYTNTSNLQIKVYDNKLMMYNGATLSSEVPIDMFNKPHQSKPFNPTMANVFYKCGFIENWGKGTTNIIDECIQYGLPKPTFEYTWTAVVATFYKIVEIDGGVNEGVNEGVNSLLELIKNNPNKRSTFFSKELNTSVKNIERWIKQLKNENKIKFEGSPKTGGYQAITTTQITKEL